MAYKLIAEPIKCSVEGNFIRVCQANDEIYIHIAKISKFRFSKVNPSNQLEYNELVDYEKGMTFNELMCSSVWHLSDVEKVLQEHYADMKPKIDIYNNRVTFHPDDVHEIHLNVYATTVDGNDILIKQSVYNIKSASEWDEAYADMRNIWLYPFTKDIDAVYNHGGM